ncbi:MAG: hypothetical protein J6Y94_06180, partial [Bacteriovoracaceae bacterium]|nr:hypothetical protein [Bacteriovoracaceae bacterium]
MLKGRRILSYVLAAMLAAGAWAAEVAPDKKSVCAKLLRPMLLPSPPTDPGGALEDSIELSPQDQYMLQEVAPQIIQGDPAHPTAKLHYVAHPQLLPQLIAWLEQQRVQYRYLHYVNGKLKLNHLVSSFLTPESLLLGIYNQERSISPDLTWANISSFFHWQWWATKNSPAEFVFLQNIPAEIVPFKYGLKAWQEDFHNWQEMITNGRALADFVEYLQNNLGLYLHLDPCHGPVDARHRKYNQDATSKINPAIIAEMVIEAYENSSLQAIIDEYFIFIAHSKTPAPAQPARPANRLQQILAISPYFALQRFQELHKFIYQFENVLQNLGLALQTDAATAHSHLVPQASAA